MSTEEKIKMLLFLGFSVQLVWKYNTERKIGFHDEASYIGKVFAINHSFFLNFALSINCHVSINLEEQTLLF